MALQIEQLIVTEIIRQTASGTTEPFVCRLSDDQLYAVKGAGALSVGLLAELYAAIIGQALGLPIPPFVLATDADGLLADKGNILARRSLGSGPLFASLWQEPTEVFGTPMLMSVPLHLRSEVYVFDHWIMNGDRTLTEHGGNPNLLMHLEHQKLIVIDHNLAFDPTHTVDDLSQHVFRQAWAQTKRDYTFRRELRSKMKRACAITVELEHLTPIEWVDNAPDFAATAKKVLSRVTDWDFWEELG